jgi:hypothetical protein
VADKIISDLTPATSIAAADLFEIETVAGNSRKATGTLVRNLASPRLYAAIATVGTDAATTEKTLQSYAMSSGLVSSDGQVVHVMASGAYAATTRSRTVRLKLGATTIGGSIATVDAALLIWSLEAWITRRSATSQQIMWKFSFGGASNDPFAYTRNATATEDFANALTIALTGQVGAGAVANDIDCRTFVVEHLP